MIAIRHNLQVMFFDRFLQVQCIHAACFVFANDSAYMNLTKNYRSTKYPCFMFIDKLISFPINRIKRRSTFCMKKTTFEQNGFQCCSHHFESTFVCNVLMYNVLADVKVSNQLDPQDSNDICRSLYRFKLSFFTFTEGCKLAAPTHHTEIGLAIISQNFL